MERSRSPKRITGLKVTMVVYSSKIKMISRYLPSAGLLSAFRELFDCLLAVVLSVGFSIDLILDCLQ